MVLFDTDILIDHLRGKKEAKDILLKFKNGTNYYSVITMGEILFGMNENEKSRTYKLLNSMKEITVNKELVYLAYDVKTKSKGFHLELYDCIIAATAIKYNLILVTKNFKHYPDKRIKLYFSY
ncbi:MAG: PIN domain-containing protein [Candidatus Firestonebacteria bacterium]|nr:PIN domain-containing protein [Candidatus Firestonebacteria bacterium]